MMRVIEDRKQWEDIVTEMFVEVFPKNTVGIQWSDTDMLIAYASFITPRGDPLNAVAEIMPSERVLDAVGLGTIKRRITGSKGSMATTCHRRNIPVSALTPIPPTLSRMLSNGSKKE